MKLFDTHCHIADPRFDGDLGEVIARFEPTDTPEAIAERVAKAESELAFADGKFDYDLVNDVLEQTFAEAERVVDEFLSKA